MIGLLLPLLLQTGPLTRAAVIADADKGFAVADTNRDGRLSPAEVAAAAARRVDQARSGAMQQRAAAFRQMDRNRDGRLTLEEFSAPVAAATLRAPPLSQIMAGLDANRDGVVTREENRGPLLRDFARLDKNRDGVLSPAERGATR